MYIEICDTKEIATAQAFLSKQLINKLRHQRTRSIGYPSGSFKAEVCFQRASGKDVFWWHGSHDEDRKVWHNFAGHGDPNSDSMLMIDLQFNQPSMKFSRKYGGMFIKNIITGDIILGHRGIVTRGNSRVNKEAIFEVANVTKKRIQSQLGSNLIDSLLVATITDSRIVKRIQEFSREIRDAANKIYDGVNINPSVADTCDIKLYGDLRDYFDEFCGKISYDRHPRVVADCRHGAIVKSLKEQVNNFGIAKKSKEIDLLVIRDSSVLLFEVKTNTSSQSIYTGIGQLLLHGQALKGLYKNTKIVPYLVIPNELSFERIAKIISGLGITLLSYKDNGDNIHLDKIKI